MNSLKNMLYEKRLYLDGGCGTYLQERGLSGGELPERWNLSHPEDIISMHTAYLNAGSNIITANTFGANTLKLGDEAGGIIKAAISNAREACRRSGRDDVLVALDVGPTGKLLEPFGDLPFEDAVEVFSETVRAGVSAGADLILIETMSDAYEVKAAVLAAKENCDLPVFVTMVFDESGHTLTGGSPESMTALLEGLRVDAIGINCSLGPEQMLPVVKKFVSASSLPVIVSPNAGLPRSENGKAVYDIDAKSFSESMERIAAAGAHLLGGCCGTTPAHIAEMIRVTREIPYQKPVYKNRTVVSSYSKEVCFGDLPVIIGERINPTGKPKLKKALISHDMEYIVESGLDQEEAGAMILDVNVGLPDINEKEMLKEAVCELQTVTALPLQIDTSDPEAMEQALRVYNGKPMINSVNGKEESMKAVFPLVQKYGGVTVALLLDEEGIPATAEGRFRIAEKILNTAASYGIDRKDIVFDALTLTISSDDKAAGTTLETIRLIREELGCHTILGVSNVSFGLPGRAFLNAHFLSTAIYAGLSAAIMNPNSELMMAAYHTAVAISGKDPKCGGYIENCSALPFLASGASGNHPGTSSAGAKGAEQVKKNN